LTCVGICGGQGGGGGCWQGAQNQECHQATKKHFFRKLFVPTLLARKIQYTDKKENQIFLICKEIQNGAVAKSYMRKGFLIYE
jgi:hypothetical protein